MVLQQLDPLTDTCGADPSWVCEQVLDWSGDNEFFARSADFLLARPLKILVIVVLAIVVNRLLRKAIRDLAERIASGTAPGAGVVRNVRDRTPGVLTGTAANDLRSIARAQTIGQVLRSVATAIVFAIASLLVLGELGINLGPLLAGAGIAGVAIGFGAQSLVKDFLSGIFMLLEDQYGVGDVIDVGEATGQVEAVTLRSTRLRDAEGTVWHVPNGEIRRVGNKSQQWARAVVDVAVAYGTDIRHATGIIEGVAAGLRDEPDWARFIQEDPEVLGVEALGADGVNIRLIVQTEPGDQFKVMRELRMRLREALDAAGIEAPFQRTKVVGTDGGDPPPRARRAAAPKAGR
jgi:small-conductance mechanosensitive channel